MEIIRSTKCSLRFATKKKKDRIRLFLVEYVRVVNKYIDLFWVRQPKRDCDLVKGIIDQVDGTWLTYSAKACAAKQALGMVRSVRSCHVGRRKERKWCKSTPRKPVLRKLKAILSSKCALLQISKRACNFDAWLHLRCLGNKMFIDIPIKFHKHYLGIVLDRKAM